MRYTTHPLSEAHFSYVAVAGNQVELKVGEQFIRFNMQTAEELCDILNGYVEDRFRELSDYLGAIDVVRESAHESDAIYQARMKARMEIDKASKVTPITPNYLMSMEDIVNKVNNDYNSEDK